MIESPWGPLEVSDGHVHFFSHRFFESLVAQKPGLTLPAAGAALGWVMPPENPVDLAADWAVELSRHGLGRAAIIASIPGDYQSVEQAVASHPARFWGYAMVNPTASDAVATLQGALDRGHIQAVCLFPAMHHFSIAGDAALAMLDVVHATRPATVIFVHCGVLSVGVRDRLGLRSLFDMRFSNPLDLHSVALRYPQLRFVVPHFGAGYFREALMLAELCPNVFFDTSSSNRWMQYEGLDLRTVFKRALDVVGARRLIFGSDSSFFPRGWNASIFDTQSKALYELGLKAAEAQLIFDENLKHLLGD